MTVKAEQCPCGRLYVRSIGQRPCHRLVPDNGHAGTASRSTENDSKAASDV